MEIRRGVERIAVNVATAMGATASVSFDDVNYGHPVVDNTAAEVGLAWQCWPVCWRGSAGLCVGVAVLACALAWQCWPVRSRVWLRCRSTYWATPEFENPERTMSNH